MPASLEGENGDVEEEVNEKGAEDDAEEVDEAEVAVDADVDDAAAAADDAAAAAAGVEGAFMANVGVEGFRNVARRIVSGVFEGDKNDDGDAGK